MNFPDAHPTPLIKLQSLRVILVHCSNAQLWRMLLPNRSGISGQPTQQNHSTHWLRGSSVKWITLLDLDGYLVYMASHASSIAVFETLPSNLVTLSST